MLALIPVIGPMLSVQLLSGWMVTRAAVAIYEGMSPYNAFAALIGAGIYPWISLAVYALAF